MTISKMKEFINIVMLVLCKKKYIDKLCGDFGNSEDVRNHLQFIVKKHQVLARFLRNDIEEFDRDVEEEYRRRQDYLIESRGGCYDCPWGNGEGGCTIPGYCDCY